MEEVTQKENSIYLTEKELIKFISFLQENNIKCNFITAVEEGTTNHRVVSKITFHLGTNYLKENGCFNI